MLQFVAACDSLLQCVTGYIMLHCVAVYCSVLQYVAVCYRSLVTVEYPFDTLEVCVAACCSVWQRVTACCNVLQRVVVCCSMLQRVAVCCSVSQRDTRAC